MAINTIEYTVDIAGITPAAEQFAGTQGDHRVTKLEFVLSEDLYSEITHATTNKVMIRFDVYDGEGGIWSSDATELSDGAISIELEERHTRYGGKITVYLVITALSKDGDTEIELYSFPARLRLNNRPDGISQDGENYESITSLVEVAKDNAAAAAASARGAFLERVTVGERAKEAAASAASAESSNQEVREFVAQIEEKLENGDFDGVGVKTAEIVNDELIITYTDDTSQNLGNVKGDKGDTGQAGPKGDIGPQGIQGVQGERGLQGAKGDKGDTGATGATGKDGSDGVGIASVYIEDGNLYVRKTNETSAQNLGRVKGDKGDTGNAVAEGVVDAVADTIPLRDGNASINVKLGFSDICGGLPMPVKKINNGADRNIIYWDGTTATSFSSTASGTEYDPIIISTAEELARVVTLSSGTEGKYYKIADGIDAIVLQPKDKAAEIMTLSDEAEVREYFDADGGVEWKCTSGTVFKGNFDGNGVEIYGLYTKSTSYSGLFGKIGGSVVVKNTIIKNAYFRTGWYAGAVASAIEADSVNVENCAVINCSVIGKYENGAGVVSIPNQCIGVLLGKDADSYADISIRNCLTTGNSVNYEYDGSVHNYIMGYSKGVFKIYNSLILNCSPHPYECGSSTAENVYSDSADWKSNYSDYYIADAECLKGKKAITVMSELDWDSDWFANDTYRGESVPVDYIRSVAKALNLKIGNEILSRNAADNTLQTLVNNKTITSIYTSGKYTFDWNAMYLIKSNSGNVDITLYNSDTGSVVVDGDGNNLPASSLCLLILPKSTTGTSGRLCMFVGMTGTFSIVNPNVLKGLQFNVESGNVYFTPTSSASIFKIAL